MRLRQHNAPKSFNWDLAQIIDPSLSFLISVMGTVTPASGAMVYIGVDLRTPDKLPRERGQAGRGARFCPARKEGLGHQFQSCPWGLADAPCWPWRLLRPTVIWPQLASWWTPFPAPTAPSLGSRAPGCLLGFAPTGSLASTVL